MPSAYKAVAQKRRRIREVGLTGFGPAPVAGCGLMAFLAFGGGL